jgi:hypothetical protein
MRVLAGSKHFPGISGTSRRAGRRRICEHPGQTLFGCLLAASALVACSDGEGNWEACQMAGGEWGDITESIGDGKTITYQGCSLEVEP